MRFPRQPAALFQLERPEICLLLTGCPWIIIFSIFPFLSAINYTFVNYVLGRGITGYVGLANYIRVLSSGAFWYSLFITGIYVSIVVPIELVLGFLLAWFVTLCPPAQNLFRPILTALGIAEFY